MFVSVQEFAKITGLSCDYVRQLCKQDGFPSINTGQKYFIYRDEALKYLKDKAVYRDYTDRRVKRKRAV